MDEQNRDPSLPESAPEGSNTAPSFTPSLVTSTEASTCPHENLSCENPFELLPVFHCSQCGALLICECEIDWFKRYDPSRLRCRVVDRNTGLPREPIPTRRICYSCRGLEESYAPVAYGRHLFSRKKWRTIFKRHIELLDQYRQDLRELQAHVQASELHLKGLVWHDIENARFGAVLRHPVQGTPLVEMDTRRRASHEFATWRTVKDILLAELRGGISILTGERFQAAVQFAEATKTQRDRLKEIDQEAENDVRRSVGVPLIGQGWITETELFNFVKQLSAPSLVIQHARLPWLGRQHLDIYVPDYALAIEYMGEQHAEPLEHFGGKEGLHTRQELDQRKRDLCRQQGVDMIEIAADEEISLAYVERRLGPHLKRRERPHP